MITIMIITLTIRRSAIVTCVDCLTYRDDLLGCSSVVRFNYK